MSAPIQNSSMVLRKRFGAWLKRKREETGQTQEEAAIKLNMGSGAMVSQIERGMTAMPAYAMCQWAEVVRVSPEELAKEFLYHFEPGIYQALYNRDPYVIEKLSRPAPTINSAPGRPAKKPGRPAK